MCVTTLPALMLTGMGLSGLGAGINAYGQYKQGQYAQDVANYNAKVGEQQAQLELEAGASQEEMQRRQIRQAMGSQRAAMAASGAVVDTGSFGDILDETLYMGEADAQAIRANAAKRAWGYRVGADMTRAEGAIAATAGKYNAMGTLLTAAGQTFGMGAQAKMAGMF